MKGESVLYEISTKKIHGKKIWIFFAGIWLMLVLSIAIDFNTFSRLWKNGFWQISLLSLGYFAICLYLYTKTFYITDKSIYSHNRIFNWRFLSKTFDLEDIGQVTIKSFFSFGDIRNKGQIIFYQKGFLPFKLPLYMLSKIKIPIYDYPPEEVFKKLLQKTFHPNKYVLYHPLTKQTFPIKRGLSLGRKTLGRTLAKDNFIGRNHAQIKLERDILSLVDQGSANKTFLNGKAITPQEKTPLRPKDVIRIGSHEFIVDYYLFHNLVKVTYGKDFFPALLVKNLLKNTGLLLLFTVIFIPLYIYFHMKWEEKGPLECLESNLSRCASKGTTLFQSGQFYDLVSSFALPCERESDEFTLRPNYCLMMALSYRNLQQRPNEKTYLEKACNLNLPEACVRLSLHTGNSKMMENGLDELIGRCQTKNEALSCKELANISSLLKTPADSMNYLTMALGKGYSQWYWISVDPELSYLRENKLYQDFYQQTDKKWSEREANWKGQEININEDQYIEFLKAKYFSKFHRLHLATTCPEDKGPQACSSMLISNIREYIQRVNSLQVINSINLINNAIELIHKSSNASGDLAARPLAGLDEMDIYMTLLETLKGKSKVRLANLVGNIFFYIKFRKQLIKKVIASDEQLQKELHILKRQKSLDEKVLAMTQKKLESLEKRLLTYQEIPIPTEVTELNKKMRKKWRNFIDNEGDNENYY